MVCPNCKSNDFKIDWESTDVLRPYWRLPRKCSQCKYDEHGSTNKIDGTLGIGLGCVSLLLFIIMMISRMSVVNVVIYGAACWFSLRMIRVGIGLLGKAPPRKLNS